MIPPGRWIYLSPHFDDAALSCGGLIWEQNQRGEQCAIWTIFAGRPRGPLSPFAEATHALWGTGSGEETWAVRRKEDRRAARRIEAHVRHLPFLDCLYRTSPEGEPLYPQNVFAPLHPLDAPLSEHIAAHLASALSPNDRVVSPLTLGGHVDHLLTRAAAEILSPLHLYYYADIPYLFNNPDSLSSFVAEMEGEFFPISETGMQAWVKGISAYASQLSSLMRDSSHPGEAVRAYWEKERGIRLWRRYNLE